MLEYHLCLAGRAPRPSHLAPTLNAECSLKNRGADPFRRVRGGPPENSLIITSGDGRLFWKTLRGFRLAQWPVPRSGAAHKMAKSSKGLSFRGQTTRFGSTVFQAWRYGN